MKEDSDFNWLDEREHADEDARIYRIQGSTANFTALAEEKVIRVGPRIFLWAGLGKLDHEEEEVHHIQHWEWELPIGEVPCWDQIFARLEEAKEFIAAVAVAAEEGEDYPPPPAIDREFDEPNAEEMLRAYSSIIVNLAMRAVFGENLNALTPEQNALGHKMLAGLTAAMMKVHQHNSSGKMKLGFDALSQIIVAAIETSKTATPELMFSRSQKEAFSKVRRAAAAAKEDGEVVPRLEALLRGKAFHSSSQTIH